MYYFLVVTEIPVYLPKKLLIKRNEMTKLEAYLKPLITVHISAANNSLKNALYKAKQRRADHDLIDDALKAQADAEREVTEAIERLVAISKENERIYKGV